MREHYEVHFTDSYGYEWGCISGKLATYEEAINLIMTQTDDLEKLTDWEYIDGHDYYKIIRCCEEV